MMKSGFFRCETCGNIITHMRKSGVPVMCCGKKMEELVPGSVDAAVEKHVPEVKVENGIVKAEVGSVPHPMTEAHFIEWIALENKSGSVQFKWLSPEDAPSATFGLAEGEEAENVYAYCNLHGLWKKEV